MKIFLNPVQLSSLGALLVLSAACSKSPDAGLRIGKEYQNNQPHGKPSAGGAYVYGAIVYVFGNEGVSVFDVIGNEGNIFLEYGRSHFTSDIVWRGGQPKGKINDKVEVVFGPGDRVPILENAPYKVEGSSVYIDWSQKHSKFFQLTFSDSGPEVFTIKNDGLVLESSTSPGFNLTLNMSAR